MVRHQNLLVIIAILWLAVIIFAVKMATHQANTNKNLTKRIAVQNNKTSCLTMAYGTYLNSQENLLDLWLPCDAKSVASGSYYPVVVFIHGGAWEAGDKSFMTCQSQFNSAGYAIASINYRLTAEAPHPAQIEDCKKAISWLRAHAKFFRLDPSRIGVWGVSAGGHLAALLGTTCDATTHIGALPENTSSVQAVCDWCGPTDLKTIAQQSGSNYMLAHAVKQLLGGTPEQKQKLVEEASPITYVHKGCPPFLIMHGADDTVVPPAQSQELAAALKAAKTNCTLEIISGANHNFANTKTISRVIQFFDLVLKKHS